MTRQRRSVKMRTQCGHAIAFLSFSFHKSLNLLVSSVGIEPTTT